MRNFRFHSAAKMDRRDIKVDLVYDIETSRLVHFVMGGIKRRDGGFTHYGPGHEEEMARALAECGKCVWAHFGGGFDFKWLLDWVVILYPDKNVDLFVANSRIILMKIGKTRIYDSWALTMLSLKNLTKGLGVEKQELALPCDCVWYCGGWCNLTPMMGRGLYNQVAEYMEMDCLSLFHAMDKLREFAADNDLDLGATIGGSAWRNAKRYLDLPDADWNDEEYDYVRLAYFGGRVGLYRHGIVKEAWYYDVSSMYPSMLANIPMPVGQRFDVAGALAARCYASGIDGIVTAVVTVPECFLGPLPIRHLKGNVKSISYPTGTYKGTWTAYELRAAEEDGVHVETILRGMFWPASQLVYKPWIEKIFEIRSRYGKDSPLGKFAKGYGNSFSGKCAARPERHHYEINGEISPCVCPCASCGRLSKSVSVLTWCHCKGGPVVLNCRCGATYMLGDYVTATPYRQIDPCAHVHHAAYLTAAARVEWRRFAQRNGVKNTIYGDTDSLVTTGPFLGSSNRLGGWKAENSTVYVTQAEHDRRTTAKEKSVPKVVPHDVTSRFRHVAHTADAEDNPVIEGYNPIHAFEGIAPKVYKYETDKGQESRAKGVQLEKVPTRGHVFFTHDKGAIVTLEKPKDAGYLIRPIDSKDPYRKEIVSGFRAGAAANQFFRADVLERTITRRYGDRVVVGTLDDGTIETRPKTIGEIEDEGVIIQAKFL